MISSQCMFDWALQTERDLGLNRERDCPSVERMSFTVPNPHGVKAIDWAARLDNPAQAVDQRIKMPRSIEEFQRKGGTGSKGSSDRRPRNLRSKPRSGHRSSRQRRARLALRTRCHALALSNAATHSRTNVRNWNASAQTVRRSFFQFNPRRRGIFRVPGPHRIGPVRNHRYQRHSRRPNGLLG